MGLVKTAKLELVREMVGGEAYEYYPLGEYVVVVPGVCGGRPTFKYTRIDVSVILALISNGEKIEKIVQDYSLSHLKREAVSEAITLAAKALVESTKKLQRLPVPS
jgi:uncharacterized protein (DUF433 family)